MFFCRPETELYHLNLLVPNTPFLYPLKTLENRIDELLLAFSDCR